MKNLFIKSAFIVGTFMLIVASSASAQGRSNSAPGRSGSAPSKSGSAPGHNKPSKNTPPKNNVPIDGGASILLAAGAAYGLKKLKDSRKKNNLTEPAV